MDLKSHYDQKIRAYHAYHSQIIVAHDVSVLGQSLTLLSSTLTILLICHNNDTLLCYGNNPFLTVYAQLITSPCSSAARMNNHLLWEHSTKPPI